MTGMIGYNCLPQRQRFIFNMAGGAGGSEMNLTQNIGVVEIIPSPSPLKKIGAAT